MVFFLQSHANKYAQISRSLLCLFLIKFTSFSICSAEYGEPCYNLFSCGRPTMYSCIDNTCKCSLDHRLKYTMGASPICAEIHDKALIYLRKRTCEPACLDDQMCNQGHCECKEDYVRSNENNLCYKVRPSYAKPGEECSIQEIATLCDPKKFSICSLGKCVCYNSYYYNFTTEECSLKEKDYKASYGEFCHIDIDCYEGLTCASNKTCQCSHNCIYKEEFGSCDCGEVIIETPVAVIITGVILGILSVLFWAKCIHKTWTTAESKNNESVDAGEENPLDTYHQESFPTANYQAYDNNQRTTNPIPLVDEPPPYEEAISSDQKPPIGFIGGQSLPEHVDNPYIPSYPPPQPTSQAPYPYPSPSTEPSAPLQPFPYSVNSLSSETVPSDSSQNLPYTFKQPTSQAPYPYPTSSTESSAPLQPTPYSVNSLNSETVPSDSSQNLPYSLKPQEPFDKNTNISPHTPYPISPRQDTGNN